MASYTIQKGDTLSKIAKQYNTTVQELAKLNNISNPNLIRAGASLTLPDSTVPSPVPQQTATAPAQTAPAANPLTNQDVLQRYTDLLNQSYDPSGIISGYGSAAASMQSAVQRAKDLAKARADAQTEELKKAYEQVRKQIYVNSRLNAVGNNEALSSLGLASNLYDSPQSGYSESSRVAQNTALRSNIASATAQEQAQIDKLAQMIIEQGITADMEYAQWLAQMQIAQANAIEAARQQDYINKLNILSQIVGVNQQELANQQALTKTSGGGSSGRSSASSGNSGVDWNAYVNSLTPNQQVQLFTGTGLQAQSILNQMRNDLGDGVVSALQDAYGGPKYQAQQALKNTAPKTATTGYVPVKKMTQ